MPSLPVLVLSQHVEQLYAKELLSTGTQGLVTCSRTGYRRVLAVLTFLNS